MGVGILLVDEPREQKGLSGAAEPCHHDNPSRGLAPIVDKVKN
jgi:hypothetical protein